MPNTYPVLDAAEQAVGFTSQGQGLWGMFHLPAGRGPHPAVLLLHGITASRIESHRLFVHLARALASRGIAALRFDFRGSGDSEGEFQDMTVPAEVADAKAALDWLTGRPEIDSARIGVLGNSLGGMIAALLTARNPNLVRGLALWAAVASPDVFAAGAQQAAAPGSESPLEKLARDGYFLLWGYPLGLGFVQTVFEQQPLAEIGNYRGRAIIVHSASDPTVPAHHADQYAAAFGDRAVVHKLDDDTHAFVTPRAEQQAIDLTVNWFRDVFG